MFKAFSTSSLILLFAGTAGFFQGCSDREIQSLIPVEPVYAATAPKMIKSNFMTGLKNPWDLAFTPDGSVLFTEKCRGLSIRKKNGSVTRLFGTKGSATVVEDFFCEGQSGMHGVALDPDFKNNRTIYVYMPSKLSSSQASNRVIRLVLNATMTNVSGRTDIIKDIPFKNVANSWGGPGSHSGGRIRFGPDGYLYIPTGDNHNGSLPQDLKSLAGKVLRVDRNGVAAPGNSTPAGGDPRIFTYGHRNVQGIDFQPQTGRTYIAEHGPRHSDEITALKPGGNGGWDPKPEAGVTCEDNYCGYTSNKRSGLPTPMTDLEKFPAAMPPVTRYADSAGMGPATFLRGSQWGAWQNSLAVGMMAEQRLDLIKIDDSGQLGETARAQLPRDRMRSLVNGPDGALYIATDSGSIWKVVPQ